MADLKTAGNESDENKYTIHTHFPPSTQTTFLFDGAFSPSLKCVASCFRAVRLVVMLPLAAAWST
ncbi:hypothetical protein E2C01_092228 [Portunus trituberculatus]|uniref:Uncharacterized protein n=1 Tax=Portunus trituberculatus TaxID=210409 RepID=A0A5B7JRG5_PORTR|nr:hypothetical protein [Portunus trituberculatus]